MYKMKVKDVDAAWRYWTDNGVEVMGQTEADPSGKKNFSSKIPSAACFTLWALQTGS
ncbi:MAG: hypothetical protein H6545_06410 [Bacteroidales bacterium]|nr:hypothetical protein [Bacteroidales bacterium]